MKIALIRLSALGDIIQSSIVLQFIKKFRPNAEIHWFIDERFKDILSNETLIDKLYALPLKDAKFFKSLKIALKASKNKYDLIIDLQGLIKSALIARILSYNVFGYDKDSLKESSASIFYNQKLGINYNENIIVRNLSLICFAFNESFENQDIAYKIASLHPDEKLALKLRTELKLHENTHNILIHCGASIENKIYPKERIALLCKLFAKEYKECKIFLSWGNEKEYKLAKDIFDLTSSDNHVFILPKLSLQELLALSKESSLIIGSDTGPTHIGFAINKPSITIFGATPSYRNAYKTAINKIIDSGKLITNAKHIDKSDFCISKIDEEDIFTLAKELL